MPGPITEAILTAYVRYVTSDRPGFAVPIFSSAELPGQHIAQEVDECDGTIGVFRVVKPDNCQIVTISNGQLMTVGKPLLYVFITETLDIIAGTLADISKTLCLFMKNNYKWPGLNLQIAELVGSPLEKIQAHSTFEKYLAEFQSPVNIEFFRKSVAYSYTWDSRIASASTVKDKKGVLRLRSRTRSEDTVEPYAEFYPPDTGSEFQLSASNRDLFESEERRKSYITTLRDIQFENYKYVLGPWRLGTSTFNPAEFEQGHVDIPLNNVRTVFRFQVDQENADNVRLAQKMAAEIIQSERQEEGIVRLLYYYLHNPEAMRTAIDSYRFDRRKFTRMALEYIRAVGLGIDDHGNKTREDRSIELSRVVYELYRMSYPMNRGLFLLWCARAFSGDSRVSGSIGSILNASNSIYVNEERKEIEALLFGELSGQETA